MDRVEESEEAHCDNPRKTKVAKNRVRRKHGKKCSFIFGNHGMTWVDTISIRVIGHDHIVY